MAPPYPRSTLRTLLKTRSPNASASLSKSFDIVAFVAYLAFLQRLARATEGTQVHAAGVRSGGVSKAKGKRVGRREVRKAKRVSHGRV